MKRLTKQDIIRNIESKGGQAYKSWTTEKLKAEYNKVLGLLSFSIKTEAVNPGGNWNTAKDWFPTINIDQESRHVTIITFKTHGYQKKAKVSTESIKVDRSADGTQLFVRGEVECRNFSNGQCSGSQKFCYAVFVGDSDHIYTHRAPATKGWMNAQPDVIRKRLRKLGIGVEDALQQGDFLLKPANGNAHPDEDFQHERMGSGHHNFELPQLYHRGQFWIKEPTTLIHTATDGIQHPDIVVPAGKWIIGTTANQLSHSNARD